MLYQLGIKDGFGQLKGNGTHLKIISSTTPVRLEALNNAGRVILSTSLRAPMATLLPEQAATVNLYSDTDQTVEIWYSNQPLEYFQLTAVGSTKMVSKLGFVYPGKTLIADANPRQKIRIKPAADVFLGDVNVNAGGWPVLAGEIQEFETIGAIYAFKQQTPIDYTAFTDTVVMSAATPPDVVGSMNDIIRHNGLNFATSSSGNLYRFDDAGVITQLSTGGKSAVMSWGGFLYVIGAGGSAERTALQRSADNGSTFEIVSQVDGILATGMGTVGIHKGLWTLRSQSGRFFAADLTSETIYKYNARTIDNRDHLIVDGFIYSLDTASNEAGGIYRRAIGSDTWTQLLTGTGAAVKAIGCNPITGQLQIIKGTEWWQSDDDGETWQTIPGTYNSSRYKYVYIGADCWVLQSKISVLEPGGSVFDKTLSPTISSFIAGASKEQASIYIMEDASWPVRKFHRQPVAPFDGQEPDIIKMLEFIV